MNKIKILFYSHTVDYGGTWRSHERVLVNLNKDIFDPYVFYNPKKNNNRLDYLKNNFIESNIIPFEASEEKSGPKSGYSYVTTNFSELAKNYEFDIIHFARSGYYEWPFIERLAPIQIETNIFAGKDHSPFLDCSVSISDRITELRGKADYRIYNPVPEPFDNNENLKQELNIPEGYHIFGRVGRPDNFDNIALLSLAELKTKGYKFKYIILGPCQKTIQTINELNLSEDCILIQPTSDDNFIHKLYNTIQVFLHYRSDGESFGVAIAHGMMYGVPVISHYAGFNAQKEIIADGGYVAYGVEDYTNYLILLIEDKQFYSAVSQNAKIRAQEFNENKIVKEWEILYLKLYENIINTRKRSS